MLFQIEFEFLHFCFQAFALLELTPSEKNIFRVCDTMKDMTTREPPPNDSAAPLVQRMFSFYEFIHGLSLKIPKKDRFGIFLKVENICLDTAELILSAGLETRNEKMAYLKRARINIELLKRLFRSMCELKLIPPKTYMAAAFELQEISKMANGWIRYLS